MGEPSRLMSLSGHEGRHRDTARYLVAIFEHVC